MELKRIQKQILLLEKAYKTLNNAMNQWKYSKLEQDWTIQRFEYTIELTWKTLKKIHIFEFWECNLFPKQIFKVFYENWIVTNLELWFALLKERNNLSHFYSEYFAEKSFKFIKEHYWEIWILIQVLKKKYLN